MAQKMMASSSVNERRRMIESAHPALAISRQCELLGLARASYWHQPEPESDENLRLMRVIDETSLAYIGQTRHVRISGDQIKYLSRCHAAYAKSPVEKMAKCLPMFMNYFSISSEIKEPQCHYGSR